jgi:hypothetical protein
MEVAVAKKASSSKTQKKVGKVMKEYKQGGLRSGSGKKVTNPKQAIAIGLSEARRSGAKVPPKPAKKAAKKSGTSTAKKSTAKKSTAKKSTSKKTAARKKSKS